MRFLVLSSLLAVVAIQASFGGDPEPKTAGKSPFVPGARGEQLLSKLYTNDFKSVLLSPLLDQWREIVREAQSKSNVVTSALRPVGATRALVLERLGKSAVTSSNSVEGLRYATGGDVRRVFTWYGSLGLAFFSDETNSPLIGIAYDPKRDKSTNKDAR
jgi:hypothetical protein